MKKETKIERKVTSWHNYKPSEPEKNSGEVLLVEDQAYTIPEIFEKFRRGVQLPLEREVFYSDTEDFNQFDLRSTVKDPYDIDEHIVRSRRKTKIEDEKVILDGKGIDAGAPQTGSSGESFSAGDNLNPSNV